MSLLSDLVPMGTSGYSGYSGYSGNSGSSGYSAYSGYSGYSAYSGTSGYSGYSGYSSTSGVSGYSAYSGKSGTSGYSGAVGSTPTTIDITVTAGEALSARDCVYIAPVTGGGLTAGRAYKADADAVRSSTSGFWCGFATAAISAAATGTVRVAGILTGFTLTAGAPQYMSATAGAITETQPTNWRIVGIALDTTNLLINTRGANTSVVSYASKGYTMNAWASEKMTVSSETFAACTTANVGTSQGSDLSEGQSKGYYAGGYSNIVTGYKITFSSDVTAALTTVNLSQGRHQPCSINANTTKGYWIGGSTGAYVVTADKVTYSTDTTAACTSANLSAARMIGGCRHVNKFDSHGYVLGGYTGDYMATADKVTYSTDTTAACTSANLSQARYVACSTGDGTTKGYLIGGDTGGGPGPGPVITADKVTYSTDTTAACTSANLSQARDSACSTGDGTTKGYLIGGNTGGALPAGPVVTADKVTFSTDTTAACTSANSSTIRAWCGGFSTGTVNGFITGGYTNTLTWVATAVTDKVTFSTDSTAAATASNLVAAKGWAKGISDIPW